MSSAVLLWDIDGTLIEHAPAKRDRHAHAVHLTLGVNADPIPPGIGKTDRQIVTEIVEKHAAPTADVVNAALDHLDVITHDDLSTFPAVAIPGVRDVLAYLAEIGVSNRLLTGNTPQRAKAKVDSAGLGGFFDIDGGFYGRAHATRMQLVAEAVRTLDPQLLASTIIVGDTVLDITAARSGDLKVIAVATGAVSITDLELHEPDVLLADYSGGGVRFAHHINGLIS